VANVGEDEVGGEGALGKQGGDWAGANGGGAVAVCGKLEAELAELPEGERAEMLEGLGLKEPALAALTRAAGFASASTLECLCRLDARSVRSQKPTGKAPE
jgi:hypothetical protein